MNAASVPPVTVVWLHGDFVEEFHVHDYAGAEPQTGYLCRHCDLILPAAHFKTHPRAVHLARYRSDVRRLLRLAALGPIIRGGDPDDNLVERGLRAELERERHAPDPKPQAVPQRRMWPPSPPSALMAATGASALAAIQGRSTAQSAA